MEICRSRLAGRVALFMMFSILTTGARAQVETPPQDRQMSIDAQQSTKIDAAIAPFVSQARKSYPAVKKRFLKGLPAGQMFFVTTRLRDKRGRTERVFIHVTDIRGSVLSGSIANEISLLDGFKAGQSYSVNEADILDWLVAKPDGSEEGNFVGKFLDGYTGANVGMSESTGHA